VCLLTYLPAGVAPDLAALRTGAAANPDGHGYAVVAGDRLLTGRGLDADGLLEEFAHVRDLHPDRPALFHSRLATHGTLGPDNCHPFAVGADPRTVIAHNGILPALVQPRRGDPRSDTRIAAEDLLPALGPLHLRRTRQHLQRWMGPHNLMVLLTVDPRYRRHAYLFNEANGLWHDGTWYSNDSYQPQIHRLETEPWTDAPWTTERWFTEGWGDKGWADEDWRADELVDEASVDDEGTHEDDVGRQPRDGHALVLARGARRQRLAPLTRCEGCDTFDDPVDGRCSWCGACCTCGLQTPVCRC